jgi:hypothetical protein
MLPHAVQEMRDLSSRVPAATFVRINGWDVDGWPLDGDAVDKVARVYRATLVPDLGAEMEAMIIANGVTLAEVLIDGGHARDEITRSDATELAAAASFLAADGWPEDTLVMPNVPKMSRRKSDSGFDAMAVSFSDSDSLGELSRGNVLYIGSVKHSIKPDASGVRLALVKSVSAEELTFPYVGRQLVVLHGTLRREGVSANLVRRLFHFLNYLQDSHYVKVYGAVAIDSQAIHHLILDLNNHLPQLTGGQRTLRVLIFPDIATLHQRCA